MAPRLTDAQERNQRAQALRAVRRLQRTLDTKIEVLERRMDRSIENKDRITIRTALGVVDDFRNVIKVVQFVEKAIADMMNVFLL